MRNRSIFKRIFGLTMFYIILLTLLVACDGEKKETENIRINIGFYEADSTTNKLIMKI